MANQVVWFDMPVLNLGRAIQFYSVILNTTVQRQEFPNMPPFGVLPHQEGEVGGCLVSAVGDQTPSANGPLLYFNVQGRLDDAVSQVALNGGQVLQPTHPIGPHGFRAIVLDSEGNRIALHSR